MADSKYLLNRDKKESARLIDQHDWLIQLLGGIVHPSIPLEGSGLQVCDVATGTAIWLLDMVKVLPQDSQLFGFDISAAQFPSPEQRPSNLKLTEHNVTLPFPEEFLGKFDIVAVRLVTAGMRGDDWEKAVKHVAALLKPGGYLQWIEPVHSSMQVFNSKPGAPNAATRKAVDFFLHAYKQILYPGPLQLPDLFAKNGLEEVNLEVFPSDHFHDHQKVKTQGKLFLGGACLSMIPFILQDRSDELTEAEIKMTLEKAMEELDGDLYLRSEMQLMVGRKPSS